MYPIPLEGSKQCIYAMVKLCMICHTYVYTVEVMGLLPAVCACQTHVNTHSTSAYISCLFAVVIEHTNANIRICTIYFTIFYTVIVVRKSCFIYQS